MKNIPTADLNHTSYVPSETEEYMNKRQLRYFENRLMEEKRELELKIQRSIRNLKTLKSESPDIIDQSNHESAIHRELKNLERNNTLLNKNRNAILRIKRGYFGFCMITGEAIGIKRLNLIPATTMSIDAMRMLENENQMFGYNMAS
ncbi:MAG: transcriptional regulator, TraR/DksA family protein [Desulfamplus sp.]|nr:transcriptional regulator, TraR/DksA family protein [Desulfamplus sp.]